MSLLRWRSWGTRSRFEPDDSHRQRLGCATLLTILALTGSDHGSHLTPLDNLGRRFSGWLWIVTMFFTPVRTERHACTAHSERASGAALPVFSLPCALAICAASHSNRGMHTDRQLVLLTLTNKICLLLTNDSQQARQRVRKIQPKIALKKRKQSCLAMRAATRVHVCVCACTVTHRLFKCSHTHAQELTIPLPSSFSRSAFSAWPQSPRYRCPAMICSRNKKHSAVQMSRPGHRRNKEHSAVQCRCLARVIVGTTYTVLCSAVASPGSL